MKAHTVSPALLEACLAYAHRRLFTDNEARLFWAIHTAIEETLPLEDAPLLAHLVAARDTAVALLVARGKVGG